MDDNKHSDQFSASLPLPDDAKRSSGEETFDAAGPATELIRKKVAAAYGREPDAEDESDDIGELGKKLHRSRHQEFIYSLTNSGRPLHEIQTAWHEYYAGLTDQEKHQVWQEFYTTHEQAAHHPAVIHAETPPKSPVLAAPRKTALMAGHKAAKNIHTKAKKTVARKNTAGQHLHSLLFGLGTGSIVILIFMFTFFNDRIIAPFIQPSRQLTNTPIISTAPVSAVPEAIIPKINVEVPVVYDVSSINDADIQEGLKRGVVHYADTALPGQNGNVVIVGHSSGNIFSAGDYKFAFSLLRALNTGDTFVLQKDGKRYTYQVYEKRVVKPTDVSVLGQADKPATATLITCDPPGLNSNRLVVTAEQISPDPAVNSVAGAQTQLAAASTFIPGNSPSLWSRLVKWFSS